MVEFPDVLLMLPTPDSWKVTGRSAVTEMLLPAATTGVAGVILICAYASGVAISSDTATESP